MSGIFILFAVTVWAAIGFALWKRLVRPRIQSSGKLIVVTLAWSPLGSTVYAGFFKRE